LEGINKELNDDPNGVPQNLASIKSLRVVIDGSSTVTRKGVTKDAPFASYDPKAKGGLGGIVIYPQRFIKGGFSGAALKREISVSLSHELGHIVFRGREQNDNEDTIETFGVYFSNRANGL